MINPERRGLIIQKKLDLRLSKLKSGLGTNWAWNRDWRLGSPCGIHVIDRYLLWYGPHIPNKTFYFYFYLFLQEIPNNTFVHGTVWNFGSNQARNDLAMGPTCFDY